MSFNAYSANFKTWDHVGNVTPQVEYCEAARPHGEFMPADWICTADMASYHQLPRSLAGAVKELFNEELSKDAREQMAGLSVEDIQANSNFINYALEDSRACLRVYQELEV